MSLCPNYCDCSGCKHGVRHCEYCAACATEDERKEHQIRHEASVKRQKSKLKILAHNGASA